MSCWLGDRLLSVWLRIDPNVSVLRFTIVYAFTPLFDRRLVYHIWRVLLFSFKGCLIYMFRFCILSKKLLFCKRRRRWLDVKRYSHCIRRHFHVPVNHEYIFMYEQENTRRLGHNGINTFVRILDVNSIFWGSSVQ